MELRSLRYFLTTAAEGNMTRAAEVLHITQPTLSRQLMDLEKELGTTLVIRGKKGLTLTDDGMFFRQRAEEIVELADRLEQRFAEKNDIVSGIINIGAAEAVGSRTLAKLIHDFSQKHPLVQFRLYSEIADQVKERLDKGLAAVGLLMEPVDIQKYEYLRLAQKETWGILLRRDHPLAEKELITPEDIAPYPLIMPIREQVRDVILNWIGKEEKELRIPLMFNLLSNAALLVEEGLGCAFCMDGAVAVRSSPNLKFIPIASERDTHSVLVWKKNQLFSPASSLFIQEINMMRMQMR